ncbi:hypothetical protein [Desulfocurvus sp. DL9XJH121]
MSDYSISAVDVRPEFDADRFLATSHAGELPPEDIQALRALWDGLTAGLRVQRIENGTGTWILAWLSKDVEARVEATWGKAPRRGFLEHALAVDCLMAAAAMLVPEIAEHGCAPVPEPSPAMREAAAELGLSFAEPNTLDRRYAVLTALPWRGGCERCHLASSCPGPQREQCA